MLRRLSRISICAMLLCEAQVLLGQDTASRLGTLVESRFPGTLCPGLSIAVAQKNRIIYSKAFGLADLEQRVPLRVDSAHRLASVSKPVSGTIVMDLVQAGSLSLDALVRTYLPELPASYRNVTIRHLLTHQAGVRGYRDDEEVFSAFHYATSRDAIKPFTGDPLLFEPGTKAEYSSFGFTILGAASEAVTRKSFQDLSHEFFVRYGLPGFSIDDARTLVPHRVRGYLIDKEGHSHNSRFYDSSNKYPAGGFTASAEDCLRFTIAVGTGKVLKPNILVQTWTAHATIRGGQSPFGLGWGVSKWHGRKMVGFNGLQPMTETFLRYFPETGAGIALFCNAEGARNLSELVDALTEVINEE